VVITIIGFVLSMPLATVLSHRHRLEPVIEITDPEPLPHETTHPHADHEHGPGCGHLAVVHGDHTDYVHDGHRHAPHGDHYDEH
jgi:zinc transport system permease protein